jgi:hypothetical protein
MGGPGLLTEPLAQQSGIQEGVKTINSFVWGIQRGSSPFVSRQKFSFEEMGELKIGVGGIPGNGGGINPTGLSSSGSNKTFSMASFNIKSP